MSADLDAPVKYRRIAEDLRSRITAGELAIGDRVPSQPQLCDDYGVSKTTADKALNLLVSEGLIVRRSGSGSFVSSVPDIAVVTVGPGTRITATADAGPVLVVRRPGAAPEHYRASVTVIEVAGELPARAARRVPRR